MEQHAIDGRADGFVRFTDKTGVRRRLRLRTNDGVTLLECVDDAGERAPIHRELSVVRIPSQHARADSALAPVPVMDNTFVMTKLGSYAVTWDGAMVCELREAPSHVMRAPRGVAVDAALVYR